ncbi:sigma-54 dependent transcriptional regulator [Thermosulfurimonas sp. F29]|uniref:sigma-54-dependent transcriptional regulator n=1 Tax=Thermosulfurimonas sp. F29 TaxID=2867247 RepID=UPI001C8342AF|nr:sigma-54 dependent transcriptional regulator [Thermosulfurimonas sp. F29]MBX6424269.1 sigma-54 dependent transcriptional regulator [Thermosulfurimonas sp. F29]
MARILVVDDEEKMCEILKMMLSFKGHSVDVAYNGREALEKIRDSFYDLVIADIKMPEMDGRKLLEEIKKLEIAIPVVFITAYASVEDAVEAMRAGAVDYIPKPFTEERIFLTVERALGISRLISEKEALARELERKTFPEDIVCVSPAMRKVMDLVERVAAQRNTTVLILGESGVGKEVVAKHLHRRSPRAKGRFVAINCAAVPENLLEAELFGYERGAFTGAASRKKGVFEVAHGGTVFLDEVGDIPLEAQAKLLRVLQERKIQRLGGLEEIPIDVRIVAATHKDLKAMVEEGTFREDLYYRINVFPIYIPPLRERREDIIPLAEHFIRRFVGPKVSGPLLTPGAKKLLLSYSFPGNVRELANACERALILAGGELPLTVEHFDFLYAQSPGSRSRRFELPPEGISLEELEKELIRQALDRTGGNQSAAARLLGLTRSKFRTRMKMLEEDK